jgi:hypothetical protein
LKNNGLGGESPPEAQARQSGMFKKRVLVYAYRHDGGEPLTIHTLEGDMIAMPGDWIIVGVRGEMYPCRADIFNETYEKVEPSSRRVPS